MTKEEDDKTIDLFLKDTDNEIENWKNGVYKASPEMQEWVKKKIIIGLIQLSPIPKAALIDKLLQSKIFTSSEIDQAFKIPIEKRKLISVGELLESDIPEEEMLVGRGLIPKEGFGLIGGLAKMGKTLLSLQLALSLVSGKHFLEEFPILKKCKVLYIYHENTLQGLSKILEKQVTGLNNINVDINRKDLLNFHLWNGKDFIFDLRNPKISEIKKAIDIVNPDVIFLDPIGQFISFDINKAENIKMFADLLRNICNCFWLLIHHNTKPKPERTGEKDIAPIYKLLGSSYLANFCESFIGIEEEGQNYPTNYKKLYLILRRESEPLPLHLRRNLENLYYETIDTTDLLRGKVDQKDIVRILQKSFKGKASYKDIVSLCSQEFSVSEKRIAQILMEAKGAGLIDKETGKRGRWFVKTLNLE
jgi:hypothetical protein